MLESAEKKVISGMKIKMLKITNFETN